MVHSVRDLVRLSTQRIASSPRPRIFVLGNTGCDLDSVTSSITFACLENLLQDSSSEEPLYVPVLNVDRTQYPTLLQQAFWLERFGISEQDLLFWSDLESLRNDTDRFFLVDHNAVDVGQKSVLSQKVLGCLDHHELSADFYEEIIIHPITNLVEIHSPSDEKNKLVGSTASLVLEHILNCAKKAPHLHEEFALLRDLVSGAVLADTANFSPSTLDSKWSTFDREMLDSAFTDLEKTSSPDLLSEDVRGEIYRELCGVKFDETRNLAMGLPAMLGADYKRFEYINGSKKVRIAYATLPVLLPKVVTEFGANQMTAKLEDFRRERGVDLVLMLTVGRDFTKHFALYQGSAEGEMKSMFERIVEGLKGDLEFGEEKVVAIRTETGRLEGWEQRNRIVSRKQVDPLVKTIFLESQG